MCWFTSYITTLYMYSDSCYKQYLLLLLVLLFVFVTFFSFFLVVLSVLGRKLGKEPL